MAFKLTEIGPSTFSAETGKSFTIQLEVDAGSLAGIIARYDGTFQSTNPFKYKVAATTKNLGIDFGATNPVATLSIFEVDGSKTQLLTTRPAVDGTCNLRIVSTAATAPAAKKAAKKGV